MKLEKKFTPGPYHAGDKTESLTRNVRDSRGYGVCTPLADKMHELEHNAQLFAAAPDLVDALATLMRSGCCWCSIANDVPYVKSHSLGCLMARAALKKAGALVEE